MYVSSFILLPLRVCIEYKIVLKWGASSRWLLSLYFPMRNSDQMTIRKTHTTLFTRKLLSIRDPNFGLGNCLYFLPLLPESPSPSIHFSIRDVVNLLVLFPNVKSSVLTSTVVAQFIPVKALMYDNHHNANFTSSSDDNLSLLFSGIVLFYFLLCLSFHLNIMLSNAVKFTACKHKRSVILIPEIKSE